MATGVAVQWPFTQATFWLSLGFNNKIPFDSIEKAYEEGQRKIFGAVLDISYLKHFWCMVWSVVEGHGKERELSFYFSDLLCTENKLIFFQYKVTSYSGNFRTRYFSITFWLDPAVAVLNKKQYSYDSYILSSTCTCIWKFHVPHNFFLTVPGKEVLTKSPQLRQWWMLLPGVLWCV